jgi:hypothetical protein
MSYSRYLDPLFPLTTFLLAVWTAAHAYLRARRHWEHAWQWALLAGAFLALHAAFTVRFWEPLAVGFVLTAVFKRTARRYSVLGLGFLAAAATLGATLILPGHVPLSDLLPQGRPWSMLPPWAFWPQLALCLSLARFRRAYPGVPILLGFVVAGVLAYNPSNAALPVLIFAGACWGAHLWLRRVLPDGALKAIYAAGWIFVALLFAQALDLGISSYHRRYLRLGEGRTDRGRITGLFASK